MSGVKLTTGETIGAWSINMVDGERVTDFEEGGGGQPSASGGPSGSGIEADDTEQFADRMLENIIYRRLKLQAKLKEQKAAASKGTKPHFLPY